MLSPLSKIIICRNLGFTIICVFLYLLPFVLCLWKSLLPFFFFFAPRQEFLSKPKGPTNERASSITARLVVRRGHTARVHSKYSTRGHSHPHPHAPTGLSDERNDRLGASTATTAGLATSSRRRRNSWRLRPPGFVLFFITSDHSSERRTKSTTHQQ